jgi:hypothetical protein
MNKSQRWASITENAKGSVRIQELRDIGKALGLDAYELLRRALKRFDEDVRGDARHDEHQTIESNS